MNFVDRKVYPSDPPLCMAASTAAMEYLQLELLIATKSGTILNFNPFSRTSVYYNEDVSKDIYWFISDSSVDYILF